MNTKHKLATALFIGAMNSHAYADVVDNQAYYASRSAQIFKASDLIATSAGYVQDDDIQYVTWKGFVSGQPVYLEIHGEKLKIHVAKKRYEFSLRRALPIPGVDKEYITISDAGSDFYVKSMPNPRDSALCIESLGPEIYIPRIPYWEVYFIANPLTAPQLYRLSGINSSCRGIERMPDGAVIVPHWQIDRHNTPNVVIDYYFLESNGVRKSNIQVTGTIASEDALEYLLNDSH